MNSIKFAGHFGIDIKISKIEVAVVAVVEKI